MLFLSRNKTETKPKKKGSLRFSVWQNKINQSQLNPKGWFRLGIDKQDYFGSEPKKKVYFGWMYDKISEYLDPKNRDWKHKKNHSMQPKDFGKKFISILDRTKRFISVRNRQKGLFWFGIIKNVYFGSVHDKTRIWIRAEHKMFISVQNRNKKVYLSSKQKKKVQCMTKQVSEYCIRKILRKR